MKTAVIATVTACCLLVSSVAVAMPLSLQVDSTESNLDIVIQLTDNFPIPSSVGLPELTGSVNITTGGLLPNEYGSVEVTGSNIAMNDSSMVIDLGAFGGSLSFSLSGAQLNATTDPQVLVGGPANFSFDLGSANYILNAGTLSYVGAGTLGGSFGSDSLDLTLQPLATSLLTPTGGLLETVFDELTKQVFVTLTLPVESSGPFEFGNVEAQLSMTGVIVATGVYVVPEPTGLVLLGLAGLGLIPALRRHRK